MVEVVVGVGVVVEVVVGVEFEVVVVVGVEFEVVVEVGVEVDVDVGVVVDVDVGTEVDVEVEVEVELKREKQMSKILTRISLVRTITAITVSLGNRRQQMAVPAYWKTRYVPKQRKKDGKWLWVMYERIGKKIALRTEVEYMVYYTTQTKALHHKPMTVDELVAKDAVEDGNEKEAERILSEYSTLRCYEIIARRTLHKLESSRE